MSIQSQMNRIRGNVASTYSVLEEAGAEMPQTRNTDNLPGTVANFAAAQNMDLLWENASPDSDFVGQNISLDLANYSHIMVDFATSVPAVIARKGLNQYAMQLNVTSTSSNNVVIEISRRIINFDDTRVNFTDCNRTQYTATSKNFSASATNNASAKPFRIYGMKGVV